MKKMSLIKLELGFVVFISLFALSLLSSLYAMSYVYPGQDYMTSFYILAPYLLSVKGVVLIPFMFYIAKEYVFYKFLFMIAVLNGTSALYLAYASYESIYQLASLNLMFDIIFIPIAGVLIFGGKKAKNNLKSKNIDEKSIEIPASDKVKVLSRESEEMLEKIKDIPEENKQLYESRRQALSEDRAVSPKEDSTFESEPEVYIGTKQVLEPEPKPKPEPEPEPEPDKVVAVLKNENKAVYHRIKVLHPNADVFYLNGENVQDDSRFSGDKDFLEYVVGVEKYDRVIVGANGISREEIMEFFKTVIKADCPLEIIGKDDELKMVKDINSLFDSFPVEEPASKGRKYEKIVMVNANPVSKAMINWLADLGCRELHLVNHEVNDIDCGRVNIFNYRAKNEEGWKNVPFEEAGLVLYSYELENINACESFPDVAIETNLFPLVDFLESMRKRTVEEFLFLSSLTAHECNSVMGAVYRNGEAMVEAFGKYSSTATKILRLGWFVDKDSHNIEKIESGEWEGLKLEPEEALPFAYENNEIAHIIIRWISENRDRGTYYLNTGKQIYLPALISQLSCRDEGKLNDTDLVNLKYHIDKYMIEYPKEKTLQHPVFEKEENPVVDYMIGRKIVDNLRARLEDGKVSEAKKYLSQLAGKYKGM